ncbi:MAG: bifunctional riboflavin kinase/FAD synthetase [Nitrospirota bacterium]|nr:bifunctional riboflavin kinase/FAD synthetase [Nitrospirota bacterium]
MRIARHVDQVPAASLGRVLAIGNFDGVHLGHRKVLAAAVAQARATGRETAVLTFDPHPTLLLRPDLPHDMLTTFEDKAEQFAVLGVDLTVCLHFDEAFSALGPEQFVRRVLSPLSVREVFVGGNYKFGMGRSGNVETLTELGRRYGFRVSAQDVFTTDGQRVSSSRVRALLRRGDVAQASLMLARPYCLKGKVVAGRARGRELGYPTANLEIPEELVPENGVYVARVAVWEPASRDTPSPGHPADAPVPPAPPSRHDAIVYIGTRPTFLEVTRLIEVHLLDDFRDLYEHRIRVDFVDRVRPEMTFEGAEALKLQIAQDLEAARHLLKAGAAMGTP